MTKIKISQNIFLDKISNKDQKDIYQIFSTKNVCRYFGISVVKNINQITDFIDYYLKDEKEGNSSCFGIYKEKKLIGLLHFNNINHAYKNAEISFELNPNFQNQGIMSLILPKFIDYGFYKLNLHRIEGIVCSENIPSLKLLEKNNFMKEGILKDKIYNFVDKRYEDGIIYSIINNR